MHVRAYFVHNNNKALLIGIKETSMKSNKYIVKLLNVVFPVTDNLYTLDIHNR